MHEWALAEAIISAVSSIAEKENLKEVREVHLRLGELQQIEVEILKFALLQMKTGKLSNAKFTVRTVRAKFKCRVCGHMWTFREMKIADDIKESIHFVPEVAHAYIKCPRCGSPDFDAVQGRGLWITSVKGVK
jgi:hydrogenase nickel incorporation protein HypA/HybF